MIIRRELGRAGSTRLIEARLVGVSGQDCSTTYELTGRQPQYFTNAAAAREALDRCRRGLQSSL